MHIESSNIFQLSLIQEKRWIMKGVFLPKGQSWNASISPGVGIGKP